MTRAKPITSPGELVHKKALETGPVVLIDVFDVAAYTAEALAARLSEATVVVVGKLPGFVSATVHVSLGKRNVGNDAVWRSASDYCGFSDCAAAREAVRPALGHATRFGPSHYRAAPVHGTLQGDEA